MKITTISFEKKVTKEEKESLGQYSSETLRMEATVSEGDNRDLAVLNLMELVHAHLGVAFKSAIKDRIAEAMAKQVEVKDEPSKPAGEQQKETSGPTPKEESKAEQEKEEPKEAAESDGGSVQESEPEKPEEKVKEEKPKAQGVPYDRSSVDHKTDYARILDKHFEGWRKDDAMKKQAKIISQAMEGKILYTATGKVSTKFVKEIKEMISAL